MLAKVSYEFMYVDSGMNFNEVESQLIEKAKYGWHIVTTFPGPPGKTVLVLERDF